MKLKKIFNETVEEINKMRDKLTSPDDITNAFFDNLMKSWGMDFTDINETETDEEDIETDNTEVITEMNFNGDDIKNINPLLFATDEYFYIGFPLFDYNIEDINIGYDFEQINKQINIIYPSRLTFDISKYFRNLDFDSDFLGKYNNFMLLRFTKP